MSTPLRTARAEAAQTITAAGRRAEAYIPARLAAPVAYIQPGSPYVERSDEDTFTYASVRLEVVVVERPGNHDNVSQLLDDHIEDVAEALLEAGYLLETISQPFALQTNDATYPAAAITITTDLETL